jgi:hypothetical protein
MGRRHPPDPRPDPARPRSPRSRAEPPWYRSAPTESKQSFETSFSLDNSLKGWVTRRLQAMGQVNTRWNPRK